MPDTVVYSDEESFVEIEAYMDNDWVNEDVIENWRVRMVDFSECYSGFCREYSH